MLILTLDLPPVHVRNVVVPIASVVPGGPVHEPVPVPALPGLEGVVTLAEGLGRQFEPGRVVGVAVDVLQEAVETVLHVVVEVVIF